MRAISRTAAVAGEPIADLADFFRRVWALGEAGVRVPLTVEREGRLAFGEADLARARLLEELVEDFDLDADAAAIVVSLVDQIHGLRAALRRLGNAVDAEHESVRARVRARLGGG